MRRFSQLLLSATLALNIVGSAGAQTEASEVTPQSPASGSSAATSRLTVDAVVSMIQAGLSEDLVAARLRKDDQAFDLAPEEMIRLKKAGVSDLILKVMLDPRAESGSRTIPVSMSGNPSGATPSEPGAISGDPSDPLIPHDSGIWLYTKDRDGNPKMIVLERAAYQGSKSGGFLTSKMTLGLKKVKMRAVIPGPRASLRITEPTPTFYFYFDDKAAGLGRSYFGSANVSNPNQFALIKLETKKSNRETIIGEVGSLGSSSGTHEESMMPFKSERIRPGLYKVVPGALLPEGEYCFLASVGLGAMGAGAAGAVDIFDFSISTE